MCRHLPNCVMNVVRWRSVVHFTQRNTVVAVPRVRDSFPSAFAYTTGKFEGCLRSECFTLIVSVERRKINRASWSVIMVTRYHNTVTPLYWFTIGTLSRIPRASSRRRSSCTFSCQWSEIEAGVSI